ncbi:MAG TPA: hypothetical protein VM577_19460 [Anaerovoracaceae bacterium]|nr:hypothetical protein [Anaerovoracaceae bacterium]
MSINRTLLSFQFSVLKLDPNEQAMIQAKIRGEDFILPPELLQDLKLELQHNPAAQMALSNLEKLIDEEQE